MVAKGEYRSFEEAREFARKLGLKSARDWKKYLSSGRKPEDIPSNPHLIYKKDWNGLEDWLGYIAKRSSYRNYLPFADARNYVRKLNLKTLVEWENFTKSGKLPPDIPVRPENVYKNEWISYMDWLGTQKDFGKWRSYDSAKKYVLDLNLGGHMAWHAYCKSGKKPDDIPSHPEKTYSEWKGWRDWTGFYPQRKNMKNYVLMKKPKNLFVH